MSLHQITTSLSADGHVDVPTGWMQGRALYGGLVAALLYRALEQKVGQGVPLGRVGQPEDIAACLQFLCGTGGSYITGAIIPVSGGINVMTGPSLFERAFI